MNLVNVIRKVRKIYRDQNNPIEAIKSIRTITGVGLKAAKDFWDWMGHFNGMSATKLAEWWCQHHWCPIGTCGCAVGKQLAEASATGTAASNPATLNEAREEALSEPISDELRKTLKPAEASKLPCPCGRKPCTDGFHANLAALIRKHGTSRAVELIHIWMGLKEPEDEAQARSVESQPEYRPIYREQQQ